MRAPRNVVRLMRATPEVTRRLSHSRRGWRRAKRALKWIREEYGAYAWDEGRLVLVLEYHEAKL
jgi:hypothetical protein